MLPHADSSLQRWRTSLSPLCPCLTRPPTHPLLVLQDGGAGCVPHLHWLPQDPALRNPLQARLHCRQGGEGAGLGWARGGGGWVRFNLQGIGGADTICSTSWRAAAAASWWQCVPTHLVPTQDPSLARTAPTALQHFNNWIDGQRAASPQTGLAVYPEGHRSTLGEPLPLKRGMLYYAYSRKLPVQVGLSGWAGNRGGVLFGGRGWRA